MFVVYVALGRKFRPKPWRRALTALTVTLFTRTYLKTTIANMEAFQYLNNFLPSRSCCRHVFLYGKVESFTTMPSR